MRILKRTLPILILLIIAILMWQLFFRPASIEKDLEGYNLVLITLDTTRADRIGCYGYEEGFTPNLDRMAAGGILFENCYSPVPLTLPSHSTMFTGTYPQYHGVKGNGGYELNPELVTLAELFKRKGYQTAAFAAAFAVDSRFGLDQGFDLYEDKIGEKKLKDFQSQRPADQVFALFEKWFGDREEDPFFTWVHFYDPHTPYAPPPEYMERFPDSPYDGEIAYMDFYVGEVERLVREAGLGEKTLFVCVGDHGEMLGEHGEQDHGIFIYESALRVPFIIYGPGFTRGKRIPARVNLTEIYATVASLFNLEMPDQSQGESLLGFINGGREKGAPVLLETFYPFDTHGWSPLRGIVSGDHKLIVAPQMELYDIAADPGEADNLYLKDNRRAKRMMKEFETVEAGARGGFSEISSREMSDEERRVLASLGYITRREDQEAANQILKDPKEGIVFKGLIRSGEKKQNEDDLEGAFEDFKRAVELAPRSAVPYMKIAELHKKMGRIDEALVVYEEALRMVPQPASIYMKMAEIHLGKKKQDEGIVYLKKALEVNSQFFSAAVRLARVYEKQKKFQEAIPLLDRLLAVEPENAKLRMDRAWLLKNSGDEEGFVKYLEESARLFPEEGEFGAVLGKYFLDGGRYENALPWCRQSFMAKKTFRGGYFLALAHSRLGNRDRAVEILKDLEKALFEDPPEEDKFWIRRCLNLMDEIK